MSSNILSKIGHRKLTYALLSVVVEMQDNICIIAENKDESEVLNTIMREFLGFLSDYGKRFRKIKIPKVTVIPLDEYYENWEKYADSRLVFMEDSNFRWSLLDDFSKYLKGIVKKHGDARRVYDYIAKMLILVDFLCYNMDIRLLAIEPKVEDRKKLQEYREKKKKAEERILSFFMQRLPDRKSAQLAFKILEYIAKKMTYNTN